NVRDSERRVRCQEPRAPGSEILPLACAAVMIAVIAAFQPYHQPGYEAEQADTEADLGPVPVIQVHRCGQADGADQQVEVRQTFVDWFRDPHFPSPWSFRHE